MPMPTEPKMRTRERAGFKPTLPNEGITYLFAETDGEPRIGISNNYQNAEVQSATQNPPPERWFRPNAQDRRTVAQLTTTLFIHRAKGNIKAAEKLFKRYSQIVENSPSLQQIIGAQYDRLTTLEQTENRHLPLLMERTPKGRVRISRERYIQLVGAKTILTAQMSGAGGRSEEEETELQALISRAVKSGSKRDSIAMVGKWGETFNNLQIDEKQGENPLMYIYSATAKSLGGITEQNLSHIVKTSRDTSGPARVFNPRELGNRSIDRQEIGFIDKISIKKRPEPKRGIIMWESKTRNEKDFWLNKNIMMPLVELTSDALGIAANIKLFMQTAKLMNAIDYVVQRTDRQRGLNILDQWDRKKAIILNTRIFIRNKFYDEREALRLGTTNDRQLAAEFLATSASIGLARKYLRKTGEIPIFANGDLFAIAEGKIRIGRVVGTPIPYIYYTNPEKMAATKKRNLEIWERNADRVRDIMDGIGDGSVLMGMFSVLAEEVIPDNVILKSKWAQTLIRNLDTFLKNSEKNIPDAEDLANLFEVVFGMTSAYAGTILEAMPEKGPDRLSGDLYMRIKQFIAKYREGNDDTSGNFSIDDRLRSVLSAT